MMNGLDYLGSASMEQVNWPITLLAISLILSGISFAGVAILTGKLFFSTHTKQFLPLEEYIKVKKDLGYEPPTSVDAAEKVAERVQRQMFGQPDEKYNDSLTTFRTHPMFRKILPTIDKENDLRTSGIEVEDEF